MIPNLKLGAAQKRFIATEVAISCFMTAVLPSATMWFLFSNFPLPIWGPTGFVVFLVKNSLGMTSIMTIIMTLVTRRKVKRGGAPWLDIDRRSHSWLRLTPKWLLLRAVIYAGCAAAIAAPLGGLTMSLMGYQNLHRPEFIGFNIVYGLIMGLILTPLILIAAMTDVRPQQTAHHAV